MSSGLLYPWPSLFPFPNFGFPISDLQAAPGSITREMLAAGVLEDLNASVAISRLPAEVKTFLAPRIVTQPPAQVTGYAERSIHIPAEADGRQLSYQWQRAGQPVAGATSPILHLVDLNASTDPSSSRGAQKGANAKYKDRAEPARRSSERGEWRSVCPHFKYQSIFQCG